MTLYKGDLSITPLGSITAIIGLYRTIIAIIVKMVFPDEDTPVSRLLRSPLKPRGPTRARDARPRPRPSPRYRSVIARAIAITPSDHRRDSRCHDPNHSRALFATHHVLAYQSRASVRVRFRSGEPVLTVYTNSVLYEFNHHVSHNTFVHSRSIPVPNPRRRTILTEALHLR